MPERKKLKSAKFQRFGDMVGPKWEIVLQLKEFPM
jgi:hypothetical protein